MQFGGMSRELEEIDHPNPKHTQLEKQQRKMRERFSAEGSVDDDHQAARRCLSEHTLHHDLRNPRAGSATTDGKEKISKQGKAGTRVYGCSLYTKTSV